MIDLDPAAFGWLDSKPALHWSKSHFQEGNKCDMLLNNLSESFNSVLLSAREKPILTMLEEIRIYFMKRIVIRRENCERWRIEVGPRIQNFLEKNGKVARTMYADYSGNLKFQVRYNIGQLHAVDLRAKTCTCRTWQLSGLPCSHVIASVLSRSMPVINYVDDIYKEAYMRTYTPAICPMTSPDLWPSPGLNPLTPPSYTKKSGCPKKARRKEANEHVSSSSRKGMTMRCKKCGESGHNRRSCRGGIAPPLENLG